MSGADLNLAFGEKVQDRCDCRGARIRAEESVLEGIAECGGVADEI